MADSKSAANRALLCTFHLPRLLWLCMCLSCAHTLACSDYTQVVERPLHACVYKDDDLTRGGRGRRRACRIQTHQMQCLVSACALPISVSMCFCVAADSFTFCLVWDSGGTWGGEGVRAGRETCLLDSGHNISCTPQHAGTRVIL